MSCYQIETINPIISQEVTYDDPYFQIVYQSNTVQLLLIPGDKESVNTLIIKALNNLNPLEYPVETYKIVIDFLTDNSFSKQRISIYLDQSHMSKDQGTLQELRFIDYKKKYIDHVVVDHLVTDLPKKLQETLLEYR